MGKSWDHHPQPQVPHPRHTLLRVYPKLRFSPLSGWDPQQFPRWGARAPSGPSAAGHRQTASWDRDAHSQFHCGVTGTRPAMRGTPLLLVSLFALLQRGEFFLEKVGGTRVAVWEEWPDQLGSGRGKSYGDASWLGWVACEVWGPRYLPPCCQVTIGNGRLQGGQSSSVPELRGSQTALRSSFHL